MIFIMREVNLNHIKKEFFYKNREDLRMQSMILIKLFRSTLLTIVGYVMNYLQRSLGLDYYFSFSS